MCITPGFVVLLQLVLAPCYLTRSPIHLSASHHLFLLLLFLSLLFPLSPCSWYPLRFIWLLGHVEGLTRRGLMCFEEPNKHHVTLPPPRLQKSQTLKSTPAFVTDSRKKRGHLRFIGVQTVQRTRSVWEATVQIYSGEVISASQHCFSTPTPFMVPLTPFPLLYVCSWSFVSISSFFSFLFYSWIIFSCLAPCCLPPPPPSRCFYSEALTQKKRELMNHLQLF